MKAKSHAWVIEVADLDGNIRYEARDYFGYTNLLSKAGLESTRKEARHNVSHIRKYYTGKGSTIKSVRVRKVVLA